jgi:hypothetical protein
MTTVLFRNVFYECIKGHMFTIGDVFGDDWMVDLMIIYIKKTIAKALVINNIIKK